MELVDRRTPTRGPDFQRQNDLVLQWGGPNADNMYRHARVHPSHTYRIRRTDELVRGLHPRHPASFMHMEINGDDHRADRVRLGITPGDDFEILLGGEGDEPNRVPLPDGALSCARSASTTSTGSRASRRRSRSSTSTPTGRVHVTSASLAFGSRRRAHLRSLDHVLEPVHDRRARAADRQHVR